MIHLVLVEGLEMVFEMNGKWVVALYLLAPKKVLRNLAKLVNVNGFSICLGISESSSVKAEIGHVVSWDGQF